MNVILTHEHADFDAVASLVGLARLLPGTVPVLPQNVNDNVRDFLTLFGGELPLRRRDELPRERVRHAWIVDTRNAQSVRGMTKATRRSVIDHHTDGSEDDDTAMELDVQAVGATSTLIVERLAAAGITPSEIEASLLLLGIYEDTGSLTFAGTTPRDLRAAAWLLGCGADLALRGRFLRHALSPAGRALQRRLLDEAETIELAGHAIVVATAVAHEFDEELASIASKMLEVLEPDALFVLVDLGTHVQMVARGNDAAVDVGVVAESLGGGGHTRAAAAVVRHGDLAAAREAVLAHLPGAVRPAARVADIMSRGEVRAFRPDQTVEEAVRTARRHGHEGYPVVRGTEILGLVTRRDLDRAMHHHMGGTEVGGLLGGTVVVVSPDESVEALQQRMMDHDVGQVPVVEDGAIVGIVTRTDVLAHWAKRHPGGEIDRPNLAGRLDEALSPQQLQAVRRVAQVAAGRGEHAYLVGGLPRDLVLGVRRGPDIDLVVDGDAPAVARQAADRFGGKVTAHRRFGTAKWLHDGVVIDLITARSEYYREPTALPSVSRGSLRSDLRRRDFTVNTLAVALEGGRFGDVIDLFDAMTDIRQGRIRVLHSLSFVEDPTRILRAVRFEVRLGFDIEPHTLRLIPDAVHLLGRVSGARIRNELRQLMAEPHPASGLERLERLGALSALREGLRAGHRTGRVLEALPAAWSFWRRIAPWASLDTRLTVDHMLVAWLAGQGEVGIDTAERLRMRAREVALLRAIARLFAPDGILEKSRAGPGDVYNALKAVPPAALPIAWLGAETRTARERLLAYALRLGRTQTILTGADLADMGVAPGPVYGRVLRAVLEARLEGRIATRAEEERLARRLLADEGRSSP